VKHGFKISEIWCLDGAQYRTEDGYTIKVGAESYEVELPTTAEVLPLLHTERASFDQVSVTVVLPVEDVVGVVFGPEGVS
jgi:hypothetical protein